MAYRSGKRKLIFRDCKRQLVVAAEASSLYFLSGVHVGKCLELCCQNWSLLEVERARVPHIKEQSGRVEWLDA